MCKKSLEEPFELDGEGRKVYVQRRQVGGLAWDSGKNKRQWQGHQPEQKTHSGGWRETRPASESRTQQIPGLLTSLFLKLVTLDQVGKRESRETGPVAA